METISFIVIFACALVMLSVVVAKPSRNEQYKGWPIIISILTITILWCWCWIRIGTMPTAPLPPQLIYLSRASIPVIWLVIALSQTRSINLANSLLVALLASPLWLGLNTMLQPQIDPFALLHWQQLDSTTGSSLLIGEIALIGVGSLIQLAELPKLQKYRLYQISFAIMLPSLGALLSLLPFMRLNVTPLFCTLSIILLNAWYQQQGAYYRSTPQQQARQQLISKLPDAIFTLDTTQRLIDFNPAACKLFGLEPPQIRGNKLTKILQHDTALLQTINQACQQCSIQQPIQQINIGRWLVQVQLLVDSQHSTCGWCALLRRDTIFELHQQLDHAYQQAAAASLTKSDFLANMGHELRTPLTTMVGYSDLLLMETHYHQNAIYRPELEQIKQTSQQLQHDINELLRRSNVDTDPYILTRSRFGLRELLQEVLLLSEPLLKQHASQFSIQNELNDDMIEADQSCVRQILFMAISNAVRGTINGTIQVRMWSEVEEAAHAFGSFIPTHSSSLYYFEICDGSEGLSAEQLAQVMRPFSQAHELEQRAYDSAILSLAMCRQLCRQLGGYFAVENHESHGTLVRISLPSVSNLP